MNGKEILWLWEHLNEKQDRLDSLKTPVFLLNYN